MDRYAKTDRRADGAARGEGAAMPHTPHSFLRPEPGKFICQMLLFLMAYAFVAPVTLAADIKETIAVLPFQINGPAHLDHLQLGLQKTLSSRLAEKGFHIVPSREINKYPVVFEAAPEMTDLIATARELKTDWLITGSLTQIGNKASIDLKITDVSGKKAPFFIFQVSEDIDNVADVMKRLATHVFDRVTGVPAIDAVRVAGNRRIEAAAIQAVVGTKAGDRLDYDKLDKDLRDIYKMGFFEDVRMETEDGPSGKIVTFHVTEKPSIGKIEFEGNSEVDDDDLKKELGISLYSILDNNEIRQSINRLKEFYREKGYYNAEIEETTETIPNNEVLLKYKVQEHDKIYIEKIQFVGNKHFDDDELKDIMETGEKWFLSWITRAGILDKKKLEFDVHKLTAFYHNHGFIKAKVGDPTVVYDDDIEGLIVTFNIVEGNRYGVDKVSVEGDLIEPPDDLIKKLQIGKQEAFNREVVRQDILTLRDVYADHGYAYAEIKPIIKENDETFLADITYDISKGQKVRFERITISGNAVTRDKVIRRELKVIEGEYFSGKGIKQSTANLSRLGFFEDIQMETKKGSSDDLMKLDVKVKERGTRTFSVGAGYSSAYSGFVMFEISDENFLGYGQKLLAAVRLGGYNTEFDVRFVEPWLLDTRWSLGVDLYKWDQEYTDYSRDAMGAALSLGHPIDFIDEYTRAIVRYDYDNSRIYDVQESSGPLYDMKGRNVTSSATLTFRRDSRDHLWNTTKGSINEISGEFAGIGGDEKFTKYRARTAWFFPMLWDTVFLVQGRWGYIQDRGKLSVFQKFFLGGINTVRGFDYESISPKDNGYRVGGTAMMCYNIEYRFPVLKEQGVVGLVFFDAGNVYDSDYPDYASMWSFSEIKKSAGAGVRWYSPIGPLRLEYGWNLDKKEDESSGRWEFSIGGMM